MSNIINPYQGVPNKKFIDNIWNKPEELQPYYGFIVKFNEIVDKIIVDANTKATNGLKSWPTPQKLTFRTL